MRALFAIVSILLLPIILSADCLLRGVQYLETGSDSVDIAVADFNTDGFPDVAIAGAETRTVRIFQNQGDGCFLILHERRFNNPPILIKSADFNGDTFPDLAVASSTSISILINAGAGKFTATKRINVSAITAIAAADFNSDSVADLAVLSRTAQSGTLSVFVNTKGSFQKRQTMSVKLPADMIAVPLGSGRSIDLVVSSTAGTISIFKGSQAGTFSESRNVQAIPGAGRLMAGFINNDAKVDLVVIGNNGVLALFLGLNENEFRRIQLSTPLEIRGIALSDFNSDKHNDLLLVNSNSRALLYTGNGQGAFVFKRNFSFSFFSGPIVATDFNSDNNSDFIAADAGSAGIFLGNGSNNFIVGARTVLQKGGNLFTGDFDGDSSPDLLVSNSNESIFLRGKGNGSFHQPIGANLPQIGQATVSDLNEDGKDDIAGFDGFILKVWVSSGKAQFVETASLPFSFDPQVQAIDLNGDQLKDLAVIAREQLNIFLNQPNAEFVRTQPINLRYEDRGTLADMNGDTVPDLVTINEGRSNHMRVYLGGPNLSFSEHIEIPLGDCPGNVSAGDANGDHKIDVVVGSSCDMSVSLFLGDGTGNLSAPLKIPSGSSSYDSTFADFNGDGKAEILAIARDPAKPSVSLAPEFDQYFLFGPFYWNRLAVEDFNRDGKLDVAVSSFNSTALFLNCE